MCAITTAKFITLSQLQKNSKAYTATFLLIQPRHVKLISYCEFFHFADMKLSKSEGFDFHNDKLFYCILSEYKKG